MSDSKILPRYSRVSPQSKRRAAVFVAVLICFILPPAVAQTPHKTVITQASRVVLGVTGVHTHADYILFNTGALDLLALQRDPAHYPGLSFKAHSSLPTNHAALPPDLAAFGSPGDPPLENPYGPIDGGSGKPGWTPLPGHQNGKNVVTVLVPTRFANWLAAQPPARRKQYAQPKRYTLTITWNSPT